MNHPTEEERLNVERYEKLYQKFIDKVKNRRKIPYSEYTQIYMEIYKENPEFLSCMLGDAVWSHGWRTEDLIEGDRIETYMMKSN